MPWNKVSQLFVKSCLVCWSCDSTQLPDLDRQYCVQLVSVVLDISALNLTIQKTHRSQKEVSQKTAKIFIKFPKKTTSMFLLVFVVVVVLLFYVHGKHLRSCRDGTGVWIATIKKVKVNNSHRDSDCYRLYQRQSMWKGKKKYPFIAWLTHKIFQSLSVPLGIQLMTLYTITKNTETKTRSWNACHSG